MKALDEYFYWCCPCCCWTEFMFLQIVWLIWTEKHTSARVNNYFPCSLQQTSCGAIMWGFEIKHLHHMKTTSVGCTLFPQFPFAKVGNNVISKMISPRRAEWHFVCLTFVAVVWSTASQISWLQSERVWREGWETRKGIQKVSVRSCNHIQEQSLLIFQL